MALPLHRTHVGHALRDAGGLRAVHGGGRAAGGADRLLPGAPRRALPADRPGPVGAQDRHRAGPAADPGLRRGPEDGGGLPGGLLPGGGRHRHRPRGHPARAARPEPLLPGERVQDLPQGTPADGPALRLRGSQGRDHPVGDRRGGGRVRGLGQGAGLRDPVVHVVLEDRGGLQRDDPALADGDRALRGGLARGAGRLPRRNPEGEG